MSMNLRSEMPISALLVDQLRLQHGVDVINSRLRRAIGGEPGLFLFLENHRALGTPPISNHICGWDENDLFRRVEDPRWMIEAAAFALTMGIEVEIVDVSDFEEALVRANRLRDILRKVSYA